MSRIQGRWWTLCVDVVAVVLIGCAVFHLIRTHLCEYYRIDSHSMEPTMHGGVTDGDLVLVDKTAWWFGSPTPNDLVVVRGDRPGTNHMVKRLAAMPAAGERLRLRIFNGDVYTDREGPGGPLAIEQKDPVEHADMRVTVFHHPDLPCEQSLEEFFHLPPGGSELVDRELRLAAAGPDAASLLRHLDPAARRPDRGELAPGIPGCLSTNKAVDSSYLNPAGRREWQGRSFYPDIGIELDLRAAATLQALLLVFEYRDRDHALIWERSGRLRLILRGVVESDVVAARAMFGKEMRLAFGYLDGRLYLISGRETLFCRAVELKVDEDYRRPNALHFGVAGGAVAIRRLRVYHDVPVTTIGGPHGTGSGIYEVQANQMFLLGDNTHDSTDSRTSLGTLGRDRLVGRPWAILAPAGRARFFAR